MLQDIRAYFSRQRKRRAEKLLKSGDGNYWGAIVADMSYQHEQPSAYSGISGTEDNGTELGGGDFGGGGASGSWDSGGGCDNGGSSD